MSWIKSNSAGRRKSIGVPPSAATVIRRNKSSDHPDKLRDRIDAATATKYSHTNGTDLVKVREGRG
jgi:hypothetical protein